MNNFPLFNLPEWYMNAINVASLLIDLENQKLNSQDISNSEAAKQTVAAVIKLQEENRDLSKEIIRQNNEILAILKGRNDNERRDSKTP